MEDIRQLIKNWTKRMFSIWGKSLITKIMLLSKITSVIQSLSLPENILKEIDDLLFKYIWRSESNKNGYERINRKTMCLDVEHGGFGVISVKNQQELAMIKWLHRVHTKYKSNNTHYKIINSFLKDVGGINACYFTECPPSSFKGYGFIKSCYWRTTIKHFIHFRDTCLKEKLPNHFVTIFNNKNILHENKTFYIRKWITSGLLYVHQLFTNGRIKTYEEIKDMLGSYGGLVIDYLAIRRAVLKVYNPATFDQGNQGPYVYPLEKLNNKNIRNLLVKKTSHQPKCVELWVRKLNYDVTSHFMVAHKTTKEGRLRSLQYKIIHHIYPTNILLHKMGIKNSDTCSDCMLYIDSYSHFFYNCHTLTSFWRYVETLICIVAGENLSLNVTNALFGLTGKDIPNKCRLREANLLILLGKLSISKYKYNRKQKNIKLILQFEILIRKKYFKILKDEIGTDMDFLQ